MRKGERLAYLLDQIDLGGDQKAAPLSEQAFARLRHDILNGGLAPDRQLKLDDLKARYAFSSSPLREALNRLSAEGLVLNKDRRGFFVAPISVQDLQEITRLRQMLEGEAIRDAITFGDDAWEAQIIASYYRLERVEERLTTNEPFILDDEWANLHEAFHRALVTACPAEKLLKLRSTLYFQAQRYWHFWASENRQAINRGSNHARLRDAVLERDAARSSDLLKNHISQTTEIIVKYMS